MYYSKNSSINVLGCQAPKTLALKWFQDWKKFLKIQPGKLYAQALLLGKQMNPVRANSKIKTPSSVFKGGRITDDLSSMDIMIS